MRLTAVAMATATLASASFATLVVDRGLPTANLNDGSGALRSNVAWGFGQNPEQYFSGDDFVLGSTGDPGNPSWKITKVTMWTTGGAAGDPNFFLGDRFENVRLFMGTNGVSEVASGMFSVGQNQTDNADINIFKTTYSDNSNYEAFGNQIQLWQVEFSNLSIMVNAGQEVLFGVTGAARDQNLDTWFNHASNAALSGSTQQGTDDLFRYFDLQDLVSGSGYYDSNGNGWDKSSDINILVEAEAVPEPATMLLGLGLLPLLRRRRKSN